MQYDITVRNGDDSNFDDAAVIRLVNNAFAYTFKYASISTTSGGEIKVNKNVGPTSTMMRALTSEDGDIISYFEKKTN